MLTALQRVRAKGQKHLSDVTAAKHMALTKGHVPEVVTSGAALVTLKRLKVPVIHKAPLLHNPFAVQLY